MKTAFVTGANRGLGAGFVEVLVAEGYRVFAGVRKLESLPATNDVVTPIQIDTADDASISRAFEEIKKHTSQLDLLINNAGANKDSATDGHPEKVCRLEHLEREFLLKMFSINTIGPLLVTKQFQSLLTAQPSFVINISSCRASYHDQMPNTSPNYGYRASKAALNMMTFCSTQELPANVKTVAVHPGSVLTDMNPKGDSSPKDQAEKIVGLTERWQDDWNGRFLWPTGEFYEL